MSNQTNVDQEQILDDKLALVTVSIKCYSGYRRATRENIQEMGGSLPNSDAVTEGSIKVFPSTRLKSFSTIRRGVFRKIASVGVKALGSGNTFAVPRDELVKLDEILADARDEFDTELKQLESNYDQWFNEHVADNQEAAAIIRKLHIPRAVAMSRFGFSSHVFKIVPIVSQEAEDADVETIVQGLARQLFEEVAAEAADLLEKSDAFLKHQKAGQKTLRPIKEAVRKMRGLEFLDPLVGHGIKLLEDTLTALPQSGYIEDSALVKPFSTLKRLLQVVSDVDDFVDAAGRVGNGIPVDQVLFQPKQVVAAPAPAAAAVAAPVPTVVVDLPLVQSDLGLAVAEAAPVPTPQVVASLDLPVVSPSIPVVAAHVVDAAASVESLMF